MFRKTFFTTLILAVLLAVVSVASFGAVLGAPKATATPVPPTATSGPSPTPGPTQTAGPVPTVSSTELTSGWALISANNVTGTGATISTVGYNAASWYPITIPSTVLGGLVANHVY